MIPGDDGTLSDRYAALRDNLRVHRLLARGGELHIASEGREAAAILVLARLGQRHFAEKYAQEIKAKWTRPELATLGCHLSFFGHLQRNKARRVLSHCDSVETIDTPRLAAAVARLRPRLPRMPRLMIQVNTSREPQKHGCAPEDAPALLAALRDDLDLHPGGVMIIPRRNADPRPCFRWARAFADRHHLEHCVMGMSADFEQAIDCGATIIRIGRAVWGDLPICERAAASILT